MGDPFAFTRLIHKEGLTLRKAQNVSSDFAITWVLMKKYFMAMRILLNDNR